MESLALGIKLQRFRSERGLSVRELAKKSGLTASMVSQIEHGSANPSINTLLQIARALEIPIYNFFKEENPGRSLVVRSDERKTIGSPREGEVVYEVLTPGQMGGMELYLMHMPSGACTSDKLISHYGEELAFVLNGDVQLDIAHETLTLHKGDSVRIPPWTEHRWHNPGRQEISVVFAVTQAPH